MPLAVDNRVQLLCQTFSSFRRVRRHFRPFAGPVAITQDRARTTDNASSAVLSTPDSMHTTNTRPLQEQLRDQMELHKLQREGAPEDPQAEPTSMPLPTASSDPSLGSNSSKPKQPPARTKNARRRRYRRSAKSTDQPQTATSEVVTFSGSDQVRRHQAAQEAPQHAPDTKKQRTLSKQEDVALCSAIKASARSWLILPSGACQVVSQGSNWGSS